ncbi:MAG: cysteine synthase family protein [Coriobacteriales bacterium]|jgi:cysteine synthase|nr:cysteine synthase family protein [Coriobacteriales bacterium]
MSPQAASQAKTQTGAQTTPGHTGSSPNQRPVDSVQELIGTTPLLHIAKHAFPAESGINIYAKLEYWNPGGSVKDRTAALMIAQAEQCGLLKPGGTIIEGTAGNMGLGIVTAAAGKGYRIILVVPTKFSVEKQTLLRALGAEVINTPREQGMRGATARANRLLLEMPDAISLGQFENPANPMAHYLSTGPEIGQALNGQVDYLVAGAGSGGTFSGVVRYLKQQDPTVCGVLADPLGSTIGGGEHADYNIEGIGNDFIPSTMDMSLVDKVIKVSDADALATVQSLAVNEGLIVGTSSGAAAWAALELAHSLNNHNGAQGGKTTDGGEASDVNAHNTGSKGDKGSDDRETSDKSARDRDVCRRRHQRPINIVTILPDRGDRYFSKDIFGQSNKNTPAALYETSEAS